MYVGTKEGVNGRNESDIIKFDDSGSANKPNALVRVRIEEEKERQQEEVPSE